MKRATFLALGCLAAALVARPAAQSAAELIVRNGLIVTVDGRWESDLRIRNGTVAEIGRNLTAGAGAREIDARGKLVLPGGVDPHSHLTAEPPPPAPRAEGVSGSRAALPADTAPNTPGGQ